MQKKKECRLYHQLSIFIRTKMVKLKGTNAVSDGRAQPLPPTSKSEIKA